MTDQYGNPRLWTFSQAQGYEDLPQPLALEEINDDARRMLWDLLCRFAWDAFDHDVQVADHWYLIFAAVHGDFFKRPMDEFYADGNDFYRSYKARILSKLPFNRLFDLFQIMMRHPNCPGEFARGVAEIFNKCQLAYVVDTREPVTILPAATEQEGQTIQAAIDEFRASGLRSTETHFRNAADFINKGLWSDSVRESIHAVESIARQLVPAASNSLGPALTSLENSGQLHPALKRALGNLYGYTSDEEGIRHPLLSYSTSPVGKDEAVFMLGACASFASYLWRRHQTGR